MKRDLSHILVIDLESTCWKDGNFNCRDGQVSEIIEIGICSVNINDREIKESESILIKPVKSTISDFCTELTTLTSRQINTEGISFKEACDILRKKYNSERRTWVSWGDYDRSQFERECKDKKVKYPFGKTHINLKNLFSIFQNLRKEHGMSAALDILDIDLEGTHHRGIDDAKNISKIFLHILNTYQK